MRAAIDALKYESITSLARPLAALLAEGLGPLLCDAKNPLLVPVPLHPRRLKSRGFNQTTLLADALKETLRLPVAHTLLMRQRDTAQQAKLPKTLRQKNLKNAFRSSLPTIHTDRTLILIDDVATTGTTLHEAARALHRVGFRDVWAATIAQS